MGLFNLFKKKNQRRSKISKNRLDEIANEIADIRLQLPESKGYLNEFEDKVRHYGEEINDKQAMIYVAERFVKLTAQKGREASIRDIECAWDGIGNFWA